MNKREAYIEILESMTQSGYNRTKIADSLLHLDTHKPTQKRVGLLSRGFGCKETEFLVSEGVSHHHDLSAEKLEEYQKIFGKY